VTFYTKSGTIGNQFKFFIDNEPNRRFEPIPVDTGLGFGQRLKRLEREPSVRLLHRTTRRQRATAEGAALAVNGRALVEDLDALTAGLRHAGTRVVGTLRISTAAPV
jgi:hypothetical protein